MDISFKKFEVNLKPKDINKKISNFLYTRSGVVLTMIGLIFLMYIGYMWYNYSYNPKWPESKKQDYINTKNKETIFSKNKFESVLGEIEARSGASQKKIDSAQSIFE